MEVGLIVITTAFSLGLFAVGVGGLLDAEKRLKAGDSVDIGSATYGFGLAIAFGFFGVVATALASVSLAFPEGWR